MFSETPSGTYLTRAFADFKIVYSKQKKRGNYLKESSNLYFDLYWLYKSKLLCKELLPGDRLPTIEALHAQHGVSHGTVRKALSLLEQEGLIVSKPGAGTFFKEDMNIPAWNFSNTTEELTRDLQEMRIEPISEVWLDPPPHIQAIFKEYKNGTKNKPVFEIKRLMVFNQDRRKRVLSTSYLPEWVLEGIEVKQLRHIAPIYGVIEKLKGLRPSYVEDVIHPWLCDRETAALLNIISGTPIFFRISTYLDNQNRILIITQVLTTANALITRRKF
jgi:DNA-binding GntR family transcriptional regulator